MGRDPGSARMTPSYSGPFELLTVEQAAARCYCSAEHFLAVYDGFRTYLGEGASLLRFPAWALHEWSAARAFTPAVKSAGSAWDSVGDGEKGKKGVRKRQQGEAA